MQGQGDSSRKESGSPRSSKSPRSSGNQRRSSRSLRKRNVRIMENLPQPKKRKRSKTKRPQDNEGDQSELEQILLAISRSRIDTDNDVELDLDNDLNDKFFNYAQKVIQGVMMANHHYEASKLKQYIDIIFRLKKRYDEELQQNELLRPEVAKAHEKLRYALELILGSETKLNMLKKSLTEAWMSSDASLLREQITKNDLEDVLMRCRDYEDKESKDLAGKQEFGPIAKFRNMIMRERDRLNCEVIELEKRLQMQRLYSESLEYMNHANEENVDKLMVRSKKLDREKNTYLLKLAALQDQFDDQRTQFMKLQDQFQRQQQELNLIMATSQSKYSECERQKILLERFDNENISQLKQISKLEEELINSFKAIRTHDDIVRELKFELKHKKDQLDAENRIVKKTKRAQSIVALKLHRLKREKHSQDLENQVLRGRIDVLEKDLTNANCKLEEKRRERETILRERDVMRNNISKQTDQINDFKHLINRYLGQISGLHMEIDKATIKLDEAKIHRMKVEKEREEMQQELFVLNTKNQDAESEVNRYHEMAENLRDAVRHEQHTVVHLRQQLDVAHSEKTNLRRELHNMTQERDNHSRNCAKFAHQVTQLTTEIGQNLEEINHLKSSIENLSNDKKGLQGLLRLKEGILSTLRKDLKDMKLKNENLAKTITDDERRIIKMTVRLDDMRKQRNLAGLQMVRRNDEIVMLKDRIKAMEFTLQRTEVKYNQHLDDIRILKSEIQNLRTERDCLQRSLDSTPKMRQEIIRLQRCLNQERLRLRVFAEDCRVPCGIHRWRILKGVDPSKYYLIEKVQRLQRRTLKVEVNNSNLEEKLRKSESVCAALKNTIERMPVADLLEKVVTAQRVNRQQLRKLKSLSAEHAIDEIEMRERDNIIQNYKDKLLQCSMANRSSSQGRVTELVEVGTSTEDLPNYSSSSNEDLFAPSHAILLDITELKTVNYVASQKSFKKI